MLSYLTMIPLAMILLSTNALPINPTTSAGSESLIPEQSIRSPAYVIPEEDQPILFVCTKARNAVVERWILPSGEIINVREQQLNASSSTQEVDGALVLERQALLKFTGHSLLIEGIKPGMDGRYSCLFSDVTGSPPRRRSFYIPYVVGHSGFSHSVMISSCVAIGFCAVCLTILLVDKYLLRPEGSGDGDDDGGMAEAEERTRMRRKMNVNVLYPFERASFSSSSIASSAHNSTKNFVAAASKY